MNPDNQAGGKKNSKEDTDHGKTADIRILGP